MTLRDKLKFWILLSSYVEMIVRGTSPLSLPDAVADSLAYLKAFGGTEQRNLPDGYIERQFIYMMDGSYLTTDIVPTYDCKIEMDFQTTTTSSAYSAFFGGRTTTTGGMGLQFAIYESKFFVDAFGTSSSDRYSSTTTVQNNTRYKFTFDNKVATLESGGTTLFTNTFTGENANGAALAINASNNNGTITGNAAGIYLYSFKVWNAQGELVMNLVPAIQKGTVPVVGFYDTVSGTFKTATAGTFAAGGEAVPTPDAPMDIVSNNGVLKLLLPTGYTQLEYIEATGTQYIDTNVKNVQTGSIIEVTYQSNSYNDWHAVYGNKYIANSWVAFNLNLSTQKISYIYGTWSDVSYSLDTNKHTVRQESNKFYIDGILTYTATERTFTNNSNLLLFARQENNNIPADHFFNGKIYNAKIWNDNTLVFNGIPCKNSSNVIGMYDTVTDTFFTNAGTGDFVAGNTVSDPVEIYTDGVVETINVHGKNLYNKENGVLFGYPTFSYTWAQRTDASTELTIMVRLKEGSTYTATRAAGAGATFRIQASATPTLTNGQTLVDIDSTGSSDYTTKTFTVPQGAPYVLFYVRNVAAQSSLTVDDVINAFQVEQGSTATDYVPYFDGGTATAEMLLKVGDYQDEQEILSGVVTRNVGVKVLDGTEQYSIYSGSGRTSVFLIHCANEGGAGNGHPSQTTCTHFMAGTIATSSLQNLAMFERGDSNLEFFARYDAYDNDLAGFKNWITTQYNAGTPVIIVYPLVETPTTESVAGQTMQVQQGDNIVEITQASLDNLELEAKYKKQA